MTTSAWLKDLTEEEWETKNDPLEEDDVIRDEINEPQFVDEGSSDRRRRSVDVNASSVSGPTIFFKDGGDPVIEPQSVGYREEYIESKVSAEIVTTNSRRKMYGTPAMTYGGLSGEFKRIMDYYRNGVPEDSPVVDPGYDIIRYDNLSDDTAKRGADLWTAEWTIVFITFASKIAQQKGR